MLFLTGRPRTSFREDYTKNHLKLSYKCQAVEWSPCGSLRANHPVSAPHSLRVCGRVGRSKRPRMYSWSASSVWKNAGTVVHAAAASGTANAYAHAASVHSAVSLSPAAFPTRSVQIDAFLIGTHAVHAAKRPTSRQYVHLQAVGSTV